MFKSLHASPYRFLALTSIAVAALGIAIAVASCNPRPPVAYAPAPAPVSVAYAAAPAPVIVQQAAPHGGAGDVLLGAAIGGLATHALTANRQPVVAPAPVSSATVTKTVIHKTTIVRAPPRAPAPLAKSAWSTRPVATASYRQPSVYKSTSTTVRYSTPSSTRR